MAEPAAPTAGDSSDTTLTAAAVGSKTGGDSCGTDVAAASDTGSVSDKKRAAQHPVCFGKINRTFLL